jgi:hypothetical protein
MPIDSATLYRRIAELTMEIRLLRQEFVRVAGRRELSTRRVAAVTDDRTRPAPRGSGKAHSRNDDTLPAVTRADGPSVGGCARPHLCLPCVLHHQRDSGGGPVVHSSMRVLRSLAHDICPLGK